MAEDGSFAGWLKDAVNSVPILGAYTSAAWGPGNYDPNAAPTKDVFSSDATAGERLGSLVNTIPFLHVLGDATVAATNAPVVGAPLKFVLDFGNRTADSFFTGVQAEDDADPETSFFDGWKHGWDTFGQEGHLSAGNIVGASISNGLAPIPVSPFTTQGADKIREMSKATWYGDLAGATTDLTAGFITPLTGPAKLTTVAREANTLNKLADVEKVTNAFNAGASGTKGVSFLGLSATNQATRLQGIVRQTLEHSGSMVDAYNFLGPKMQHASEHAKRIVAEVAVTAKTLDPVTGEHVMGNALLASMGSEAAKAEVISVYPLIAAKIANASLPPSLFDDVSKAQAMLSDAFHNGGDVKGEAIMSQIYDTPRKVAEQKAISDLLEIAKTDATQARELRSRLASLRPKVRQKVDGQFVDTFDNARLKEARAKSKMQLDDLRTQLAGAKADLEATSRFAAGANKKVTSKATMQDVKAAADSRAGRDAVAAFGPYKDAEDFNKAHGAAQQKVDDLTARLAEVKGDSDLLSSTPLDDAGLEAFRTEMGKARAGTKQAVAKRDFLDAMNRTAKRELRDDARKAKAVSPTLNATHAWLADIDALGEGSNIMSSLSLAPTALERAKTAYRDYVGRSYLFDAGDYSPRTIFHQWPQKAFASIGTDYGRSAVQTLDRYRGMNELAQYLKKSGVYAGDEIKATTEAFLRAQPGEVAQVLTRIHDQMLERIVTEVAPEMNKTDVSKAIGQLNAGMHSSRSYLAKAVEKADAEGGSHAVLQEFPDATASGAAHRVDAAFLRSHLADTVPFADPVLVRKALQAHQGESALRTIGNAAIGMADLYTTGWKLANLIRPGLFFRNMMDTGLRAVALMGTAQTTMSVVNGVRHKMRNDRLKAGDWVASRTNRGTALERIGLHDPEGTVRHYLGDGGVKVDVGGGKTANPAFYEQSDAGHASATALASMRSALTRGMPYSEGLMAQSNRTLDKFLQNRKVWDVYRADSAEWPRAYAEHAEVLLASPTARKLIEMHVKPGVEIDGPGWVKEMFSDPAVREEYARFSSELNMSREAWLEQVLSETDIMFPEPGMAADLMAGRFKGRRGQQWIDEHFPAELRFDVPGFESVFEHSARHADSARTLVRKSVDNFFRVMMDEPDFWLTRHPVAVNAFSRQVKMEASRLLESRVRQFGDDAELSARDIKRITERARVHAVSTVRDYMYDAVKNTGLSQSLHFIVPFFGPYQDVMRAYGRLIYDDPQRLFNLSGLYNAPTNLNQWLPEPIIVDINGNPVMPGQVPEQGGGEAFIVLNGIPGFDGSLKLRRSSFNTLLQGDVPWLPGWGPAATIPATLALNSDKELALQLSQSDNPFTRTLMSSLFMDGQVPNSDLGSLAKSQVPAWLRRYMDGESGIAYGRNVQYALNQAYIRSQQTGAPFDYNTELAKAQKQAQSANQIQTIAQFGFGISGNAEVQGTFYVQQMHQLQALGERPPGGGPSALERAYGQSATPEGVFAQMFPEAANLRWSFTRNETGINATAQAQQSALGLEGLINQNPDLGWWIVGGDNVGGQWSQTAYNQQKQGTYGISEKGRKSLSPAEMATAVRESFGWDEFTKWNTELSNLAAQHGFSQTAVSRAKQAIVQMIGQENSEWYAAYNDRTNKLQDFYQKADLLASNPAFSKRQDIAMYVEYRKAMQEVLDTFGLKSLAGTGIDSVKARASLNAIGSQMARQNIGFQQMWDRMLYNDVKPKASDARFGYVDTATQPNTTGVDG